jgi:hypothetical protein
MVKDVSVRRHRVMLENGRKKVANSVANAFDLAAAMVFRRVRKLWKKHEKRQKRSLFS